MAEREGFEPSRPFRGLRDFESRAFDHSAISPKPQDSTAPKSVKVVYLGKTPVLFSGSTHFTPSFS